MDQFVSTSHVSTSPALQERTSPSNVRTSPGDVRTSLENVRISISPKNEKINSEKSYISPENDNISAKTSHLNAEEAHGSNHIDRSISNSYDSNDSSDIIRYAYEDVRIIYIYIYVCTI
jgi:hypothetical protein